MTTDEARFTLDRIQYRIDVQQWADNAEYARRALDRLRERKWEKPDRWSKAVDAGPACTGWEREVLERQVLNYVLDNGYFPSAEHVKTLKKNAREAKAEMPTKSQLRIAFQAVAA